MSEFYLKRCPFCGGVAETVKRGEFFLVECQKCYCETDGWKDEEDAVGAWNQREQEEGP